MGYISDNVDRGWFETNVGREQNQVARVRLLLHLSNWSGVAQAVDEIYVIFSLALWPICQVICS